MAKQRTSPLLPSLLALLIGGGAWFFLAQTNDDNGKKPSTDSTVTATADGKEKEIPITSGSEEGIVGIFFSNTYANNPSIGENDPENIDRKLTALIAAAQKTIDCALFELESKRIAQALIDAAKRGVKVRIAGETDYGDNQDLKDVIKEGIPFVPDERSGLMHNKFIVVDSHMVWTGSFNTTDNGAFRNNNNAILIRSRQLAHNYEVEFEEMFARHQFGPRSPSNTPNTLVKFPDADIYNYFSPEDDVQSKIVRYLTAAKSSIHFLAFSITDDSVGNVMIRKHDAGLDVQGVVENRGSGTIHSERGRLSKAGIEVLPDGNKYVMHHKVIVIDGTWTIMGSYNFTESALKNNDENVLIIKSTEVAKKFEEEYQRIKRMAQQNT